MIELLDDRVAIIPVEDPNKIGSIWIPDVAKKKADQGVIKYRGKNVKELKVGDHVLFPAYSGQKIAIQGEGVLFVMREEDVLCLLGEGKELFTQEQIEKMIDRVWYASEGVAGPVWGDEVQAFIEKLMDELTSYTTRRMEN